MRFQRGEKKCKPINSWMYSLRYSPFGFAIIYNLSSCCRNYFYNQRCHELHPWKERILNFLILFWSSITYLFYYFYYFFSLISSSVFHFFSNLRSRYMSRIRNKFSHNILHFLLRCLKKTLFICDNNSVSCVMKLLSTSRSWLSIIYNYQLPRCG